MLKRPRLLNFLPDAQQIIAVTINEMAAFGVLADLGGGIGAVHRADLDGAQGPEAISVLEDVINGLLAQLHAPLSCLSIGTPGIVDSAAGIVKAAPSLDWYDLAVADMLADAYDAAVYVGNNTELAARAQQARGVER